MMRHKWPGNVREIERLVLASDRAAGLQSSVVQRELRISPEATPKKAVPLTWESVEKALQSSGSEVKAADLLGVDRAKRRRWRKKNGV
jgi:transcriptional regulator with PAS, ATPase and Fis domain